nr:AHS beta [Cornechiniscus lobatus]
MAIRYFALAALLLVAGASAQRFAKHETIRELPEACQQDTTTWTSSSSRNQHLGSAGTCKVLPPVYDSSEQGYAFCLKCKAGEKHGVTAEELAQGIRQAVERKIKQNRQFTPKSKLDIIIDGVKQPLDLTRVLARTPDVLEQVNDVYFFFPNKQIGRIEFEHGQPEELERITCRAPCRGGPKQTAGQSPYNNDIDENEDEDEDTDVYGGSSSQRGSSSSAYMRSQEQLKKQNKNKSSYPYSYGGSSSSSYNNNAGSRYGVSSRRNQQDEYYGETSTPNYRSNAGRSGDLHRYQNQRSQSRYNNNEVEDD